MRLLAPFLAIRASSDDTGSVCVANESCRNLSGPVCLLCNAENLDIEDESGVGTDSPSREAAGPVRVVACHLQTRLLALAHGRHPLIPATHNLTDADVEREGLLACGCNKDKITRRPQLERECSCSEGSSRPSSSLNSWRMIQSSAMDVSSAATSAGAWGAGFHRPSAAAVDAPHDGHAATCTLHLELGQRIQSPLRLEPIARLLLGLRALEGDSSVHSRVDPCDWSSPQCQCRDRRMHPPCLRLHIAHV